MTTAHKAASGHELQYRIKEILDDRKLQNVVNLLLDWLHSGELSIGYYHFMHICTILQDIGIRITNDGSGLKYIAGYLLLSRAEEIMSIERSSHEMSCKMNGLIYTAVHETLENLDLLNSQMFTSS